MANVNTLNQGRVREDLADYLVVADAKNTPVTSMIKKGKEPANVLFEWPVAEIPDADTTAIADGAPVTATENMSGNRQILSGRVHHIRRAFGVTKLTEINKPAGVANEFEKNKMNALTALKRAIEAIFCGDQDSSLSGSTYTTRGLGSWIKATAQTDLPVHADYLTPAGNIKTVAVASLTEDDLRDIMQSIFEQTGQMGSFDCPVGTNLKSKISTFTIYVPDLASNTVVRRYNSSGADDNTVSAVVDVVKGDFGTMRLHPTLWNAFNNTTKAADNNRGYVLDLDDLDARHAQLPGYEDLPNDGSGKRGFVDAIVGLQVGNPLKHGKIVGS